MPEPGRLPPAIRGQGILDKQAVFLITCFALICCKFGYLYGVTVVRPGSYSLIIHCIRDLCQVSSNTLDNSLS